MSTWNTYYKSGVSWILDGNLAIPNDDLSTPIETTMEVIILEDGSEAVTIPETKYRKTDIEFIWTFDDRTIFDKIDAYVKTNKQIKIVTHLSGEEYIGYFLSIKPTWLVGYDAKWGISAIFKPLE